MKDSDAIDSIIEEFADSTDRLGLGSMPGKVWGTLYFYGNMTQDELKNHLGVGLSRISPALKLLQNFGGIRIVGKEGRKNIYEAETSMQRKKRVIFENMLIHEVEPISKKLDLYADRIKSKNLSSKVNDLRSMFTRVKSFLKLILKLPFGK